VHGVSTLILKLQWPSDHVCNGGTWKNPVRLGVPRRKFPKKINANHSIFFSKHTGYFSRMFGEKYGENGDKFGFVTMSM
jgi:hypothetical protein